MFSTLQNFVRLNITKRDKTWNANNHRQPDTRQRLYHGNVNLGLTRLMDDAVEYKSKK